METTGGDVDAEAAAKKRRRSKWDTPAATPTPSAVDSSIVSNTVLSSDPPHGHTAIRPPLPMGLPAPPLTTMLRMPPLVPLQMPMMPMMPIINTVVVPIVSKLDCRIYVGWVHYDRCHTPSTHCFL